MKKSSHKAADTPKIKRSRALTAFSVTRGATTKAIILDAAERLFAINGFDGTSMRQIAQTAGIPVALVSYHFESKLGLYKTVFRRHLDEITRIRIDCLKNMNDPSDLIEAVRSIVRVLAEPMVQLEVAPGGRNIARLLAREINDPRETDRGIIEETFDPIAQVVISKLKKLFPDVDAQAVYWAFLFTTGAIAINHAATGRIERLSSGLCTSDDASDILHNLIEFITGGVIATLLPHTASHPRRSSHQGF